MKWVSSLFFIFWTLHTLTDMAQQPKHIMVLIDVVFRKQNYLSIKIVFLHFKRDSWFCALFILFIFIHMSSMCTSTSTLECCKHCLLLMPRCASTATQFSLTNRKRNGKFSENSNFACASTSVIDAYPYGCCCVCFFFN